MRAKLLGPILSIALALLAGAVSPARANWLSALERGSVEAGGDAARFATKLGPVGKAAAYLKDLTGAPKGALAAHATPEGHWEFANRDGQTFTVGTPDEMKRVLPSLAPEVAAKGEPKLTLYLTEESVFANRAALGQIPPDADLYVVTDYGPAIAVTRTVVGADEILSAQIKPHLAMDLDVQTLFDETMFRLSRPLDKASIRTIAFEPGAPTSLGTLPKLDPDTKLPLADPLDPKDFDSAFAWLGGQTAIVTGRVGGGRLAVTPAGAAEMTFSLEDMINGARRNDVNLIVLESASGRQAGGRNWLWQRIEVRGLKDATNAATFGDFLDALAAERGGFKLATTRDSTGRVHISAGRNVGDGSLAEGAANTVKDWVGEVTGDVMANAVDIDARDRDAQSELDTRLIPWVPTFVQFPYLAGLLAGLLSWSTARSWWLRLVPTPMPSSAVPSFAGKARQTLFDAAFVALFLPLAGLPALTFNAVHQAVTTLLAPILWIKRRFLTNKV